MVVMACLVAIAVGGCGTEGGAAVRQADRGTPIAPTPSAPATPKQPLPTESTSPSSGVSAAGSDPTTEAGVAATAPAAPKGLPSLVRTGPTDRPRVALTFDADMTPAMLRRLRTGEVGSHHNATLIAELRRLQVPATLFLTGLWTQHYPDVTRELAADPLFELGTHTWQHGPFTADCYGLPSRRRHTCWRRYFGRSVFSMSSPATGRPGCSVSRAAATTAQRCARSLRQG